MYTKSVYSIPQKIKCLTDKRQRKSIPFTNVVMIVLTGFLLQYKSFNELFNDQTSTKRLKHLVKGKIPKTDAAREIVVNLDTEEVREIQESVVDRAYKNKVFRQGTIGGYKAVAIDGVELFSSYRKKCKGCLTRKRSNGETEYYHQSVVCMSIGSRPHLILGEDMIKPRDGEEPDEGELTGAKRLIRHLYEKYHHFTDVVVGDGLYLNAPFIRTVQDCKMNVVIRLKEERRLIYQDAVGLFKGDGEKKPFVTSKISVKVWDLRGFSIEGLDGELRVLKFEEQHPREKDVRLMYVVTDMMNADYKIIWKMMHQRWDIENNGFHQLKTYYHADHCFVHKATENLFLLNIIAFNLRELFLYRRMRSFVESGMTKREITKMFDDDLLVNDYRALLFDDG